MKLEVLNALTRLGVKEIEVTEKSFRTRRKIKNKAHELAALIN